MGASASAPRSPAHVEARERLSGTHVLSALDALYAGTGVTDFTDVGTHFPSSLAQLLWSGFPADSAEEALTIACAACECGSDRDVAQLVSDALHRRTATGESEEAACFAVLQEALRAAGVPAEPSHLEELCKLQATPGGERQSFLDWASSSPALLSELRSSMVARPRISVLLRARDAPAARLLTPALAWWLRPHLSKAGGAEWTFLFSSASHGRSFRTLSGRISGRGAVLVLMRDSKGRLAAGASDVSLSKRAAFAGGAGCRVARLSPGPPRCYPPSGTSNTNLAWFAEGFESVPNGIGFGGQVGHHALFMDASMEGGHSRYSATYANPPLLGDGDGPGRFELDVLEVWSLDAAALAEVEEAAEKARRRAATGSVLDTHAADRAFINLASDGGRAYASDGHRDPA